MFFLLHYFDIFVRPSQNRQKGATLVEYALIIGLIAIGVLIAGTTLSGDLTGFFDGVGDSLGDGTTVPGGD